MSFRGRTTVGRGVRPTQVFKKRNNVFATSVPSNADATLLSEIVLRETGTIYSVKISCNGNYLSAAAGDAQRINIWVRCVPAVTALPDLTAAVELDTMNGFLVASFMYTFEANERSIQGINEKFRFRRKCDENSLLQLLAQSTNTQGTGRVIEMQGVMAAVIRVK